MVTVRLTQEGLEVSGHAPRAPGEPPGQNIICAAVSAITLTLIEGLKTVAGMQIDVHEASGDVKIRWTELNTIGKALVDTWEIGIRCIQESYENSIIII